MTRRFRDRRSAGALLAAQLVHLRDEEPIVLALPRGGVPVAFEVARALQAPLDVIVVRKLGLPFHPELGMGAIGEDGVRVLDPTIVQTAQVSADEVDAVEARERVELARRVRQYRGDRPMIPLEGRTVIVVDDGIATGGTARAALQIARLHGARRVVLAAPVAPPEVRTTFADAADEVVIVATPTPFYAIGQWYERFGQTGDDEVRHLLDRASRFAVVNTESDAESDGDPGGDPDGGPESRPLVFEGDVDVATHRLRLPGTLVVPERAAGLVLFAHGSGSSRLSPRNQYVARSLQSAGLATLQFDLLAPDEARERGNVFDIELLSVRLLAATEWVRRASVTAGLPIGYFGASTGAAAALWAAAEDLHIGAVVSRGGRPDLAASRLDAVVAPTLLIVGGDDAVVLQLNRHAASLLRGPHELTVVPGATHLFEEPGALERVAELSRSWFLRHLATSGTEREVPRRAVTPGTAR